MFRNTFSACKDSEPICVTFTVKEHFGHGTFRRASTSIHQLTIHLHTFTAPLQLRWFTTHSQGTGRKPISSRRALTFHVGSIP